jgi:hypothetical protein
MNVFLSLLIYNPLEAYTLVLLCDIITGNDTKFTFKNLPILWVFGSVNFIIQCVPNIVYGEHLFVPFVFIMNYMVVPVSIFFFYRIISVNIAYKMCVISELINCIFIVVISSIFNVTIESYNMFYFSNRTHEFVSNLVIFFVQILLYGIIKYRRVYYEKLCKGNRK